VLDCLGSCGDEPFCQQQCVDNNPEGANLLFGVIECINGPCSFACGGGTGGGQRGRRRARWGRRRAWRHRWGGGLRGQHRFCGDAKIDPGEQCDEGPENTDTAALRLFLNGFALPIAPIDQGGTVQSFYNYFSASSHTGLEDVGASRVMFYRDLSTGQLSLIVHHGIDQDTSGLSQPNAQAQMKFGGPSSMFVIFADDNQQELSMQGPGAAFGNWTFANNSDGGILGGFPFPGDWSLDISPSFSQNISSWAFVDGSGNLLRTRHQRDHLHPVELQLQGALPPGLHRPHLRRRPPRRRRGLRQRALLPGERLHPGLQARLLSPGARRASLQNDPGGYGHSPGPMSRARLAFLVVLGLALLPSLTLFSAASAEESASVIVEVASSLAYLDEEALRKAIGAELRTRALPPGGAQASGARGTLLLGLDRVSGELVMTYRARGGGLLVRNLKLPAERGAQITTIALLAGNLARDEAAELLAAMKPAPGASSGPASPAPASSSGAVSASALLSSSASASSSATPPPTPSASTSASSTAPRASVAVRLRVPVAVPRAGLCAAPRARREPISLQLVPGVGYPLTTAPYHTRLSFSLLLGSVGEVREGAQLGGLLVKTSGDASWVSAGGIGSMIDGRTRGGRPRWGLPARRLRRPGGPRRRCVLGAAGGAQGGPDGGGGRARRCRGRRRPGGRGGERSPGKVTGFQVSGLVNLAPGGVEGAQVAGLVNMAGDRGGRPGRPP
jgi:hypothetical protein